MQSDNENNLWEELKLLQVIIDKFDDISFRIKNWFFTILSAITGYAIVNESIPLLLFNFGVITLFYFYEATYRISQRDFLKRNREIQMLLRKGVDPTLEEKGPYLDKYLLQGLDTVKEGRLYAIQSSLKVPSDKAKRNHKEFNDLFITSVQLLFQVRVSLPYLIVIFINSATILWLFIKNN